MPISEWDERPIIKDTETKLRRILKALAITVQGTAKFLCPFDTGHLRKSISYLVKSAVSAIVGSNVEYAAPVELGSKKWKGKPYLRPALDKLGQKDVDKAIGKIL